MNVNITEIAAEPRGIDSTSSSAQHISKALRIIFFSVAALMLISCAEKNPSEASAADGTAPERAIFLGETDTTFEIIALQEEWIKEHYPGAEMMQQDLIEHEDMSLDMITLKMPDDSIHVVYFTLSLAGGGDS